MHLRDYLLSVILFLGLLNSPATLLYGQVNTVFPAITGSWEVEISEDRTGGAPLFGKTDFNGIFLHLLENGKLVWQNKNGYFVADYQQSNGTLQYDNFQLKIEYAGEENLRFFYDEPVSKRRVILILKKSDPLSPEATTSILETLQQPFSGDFKLDGYYRCAGSETPTSNLQESNFVYWIPVASAPPADNCQACNDLPLAGRPPAPTEIYKVVEEMPRFPGCEDIADDMKRKQCAQQELLKYVYKNLIYPTEARNKGVEGTVVITFVVEIDGRVSNARIVRDLSDGLGEEALRVINQMNLDGIRWIPGSQRGEAVRIQFNLPVKFKL